LLLLRGVLAIAVLTEGSLCIAGGNPALAVWFSGLAAIIAGIALLIGFLTPIAAAVIAAVALAIGLSVLPACAPGLFDSKGALLFGVAIVIAILGLGPGAFSVDARVFGRREIIIPPQQ
jgi:uncharacterized membrane protein YphA (DoxX/SURF4 family)